MSHRTIMMGLYRMTMLGLAILPMMLTSVAAHAAALADITNMTVTPRDVGTSTTQGFNLVATGLNTVGIGKTVYLAPAPKAGSAGSIKGYTWSVTAQPSAGAAAVDVNSNTLFKFHPTKPGGYTITLTPLDQNSNPTTATTVTVWAAEYLGATGGWSCATCHDGIYLEDKVTPWSGTKHATMLTRFLNGEQGAFYSASCLPCHTVGAYANTRGDGNFLDVAQTIGFDLTRIPAWVKDAAATGTQHWNDLPAALQQMANIQCESCHGPGKTHNGSTSRISVPSWDGKTCSYCHDAPTHHMRPYQWRNSAHSKTNSVTSSSCSVSCHTSEGFVAMQVDGNTAIPADLTSRSPLSCVGCHDPHDATNPHQLRKVDPVTLPNGRVFDFGMGSLCANCHNSRIADPVVSVDLVTGSSRGSHYGPQADIFLGSSAYNWGQSFPVGLSPHYLAVEDGCVDCHMAAAPSGSANPPPIGDHTWRINDEVSGTSTAPQACGGCHEGLTTTDRVPAIPRDFDGNGTVEGVQTEVAGLLANLRAELLNRLPGSSYSASGLTIGISTTDWKKLTLDQRAARYNFNLISRDRSEGVHNMGYSVTVLQRSYLHLTEKRYNQAFPKAFLLDNDTWAPTSNVSRTAWQLYE